METWKRGLPITAWALRDFTASILPRSVYEARRDAVSFATFVGIIVGDISRGRKSYRDTRSIANTNTSCVDARKFVSVSFVFTDR